jgi:hypothetical protein
MYFLHILQLFDMKKFQQNVNRELRRAYPDRRRLECQCLSAVAFVKSETDLLDCPIWVLIINIVAMDMLKSKLPPGMTNLPSALFVVLRCILISSKICQQMHSLLKRKMLQLTLKTSLYMAPTCFGPFGPSSASIRRKITRRTAPSTHSTYCHRTATILTMYFY